MIFCHTAEYLKLRGDTPLVTFSIITYIFTLEKINQLKTKANNNVESEIDVSLFFLHNGYIGEIKKQMHRAPVTEFHGYTATTEL